VQRKHSFSHAPALADLPAVVPAARRCTLSTLWVSLASLASCVVAAHARAQLNPDALPAAAPAVLSTRDPASAGPGRTRDSFASITKPAKPAQVATAGSGATDAFANVDVSGIKGTLNKGDVHQTMEARQELFDACIRESRRSVRWVSGSIKYAFRVDGEGRIAELRPVTSTIGHRALEVCLTTAVMGTQFPKPAGRASAEFSWGMSVEPLSRGFDDVSAKVLKRIARKNAKEVFRTCEIRRRRAKFRVTAYIAAGGRVLSAGAVPLPATADDKVDCVLEQFGEWHLPKLKRASKITFDLR